VTIADEKGTKERSFQNTEHSPEIDFPPECRRDLSI
jgi:hypothetical protein